MQLIPQRPCLYCRLSYAPDGSLEKVERQEADGRAMGARLGWPDFCCVYVDNSRSAWQRNRKRPDWDRMLISLEPDAEHHHDGIMTYHGDRLIRQPYDLELLLNIAQARHVPLASVSGVRDLSSADDRFILRIEAAQACRESDNISRRQKTGHKHRVTRKGRGQQGGKRPYGWGAPTGRMKIRVDQETGEETEVEILDYDMAIPEETGHLAEVADRILAGLSRSGGVRYMNSVSTTSRGGPWTSRVLGSCLTSPRIAGLIEYEGVLHQASWDPVISNEKRLSLIAIFEKNRETHPNPGPARVHMLSGVAECGRGHGSSIRVKPMGGKGRNKQPGYSGYKIYYCRTCNLARNKLLLEAYVSGEVVAMLSRKSFLTELHQAAVSTNPDLGAEIIALERRKKDLQEKLDALADHQDLDPIRALTGLASFDKKISELSNQLAVTAKLKLLRRVAGFTLEQWEAEPVDVRAEVVSSLFRVVILPTTRRGPGFDTDSVELTRKPLTGTDQAPPA